MEDENHDCLLDLEEEQRRAEYCYECGGYADCSAQINLAGSQKRTG